MSFKNGFSAAILFSTVILFSVFCGGGDKKVIVEGSAWKDTASGLTWQNPSAKDTMTWQEADDYCNNMSLGGYDDWRLPIINELRSLIRGCAGTITGGSCGITDSCLSSSTECWDNSCRGCEDGKGPANGCYWPNEMGGNCGGYWSYSTRAGPDGVAWAIYFNEGYVLDGDKGYPSLYGVRCVRKEH
jgi:hypothetical protein